MTWAQTLTVVEEDRLVGSLLRGQSPRGLEVDTIRRMAWAKGGVGDDYGRRGQSVRCTSPTVPPRENTRTGLELEPVAAHLPVRLHTSPLSCPPSESRVGGNDRYPAFRRGNDNLLRFTAQYLLSYKQADEKVKV